MEELKRKRSHLVTTQWALCLYVLASNMMLFSATVFGQVLPDNIIILVPRPYSDNFITMELTKYSVRDPEYCKYFHDDNTSYTTASDPAGADLTTFREIPLTDDEYPVRTYRGRVLEQPNSSVVAIVWPGETTLSAFVDEGQHYIWGLNSISIDLDLATVVGVSTNLNPIITSDGDIYDTIFMNKFCPDSWKLNPTIGNRPDPEPVAGSGPWIDGPVLKNGWTMRPNDSNFKKMQIAYEGTPAWFDEFKQVMGDEKKAFYICEHATNYMDLVYARSNQIQYRMTALVIRHSTVLHTTGYHAFKTWRDNGLGDNSGTDGNPNTIPFQHLNFSHPNTGYAFSMKKPLNGGNATAILPVDKVPAGLCHEISHTWGGKHYVWPKDTMSSGGPWFSPPTNALHNFNRNSVSVASGLPTAANVEYGWNLHPYGTPDLATTGVNQPVSIPVLANDFDANGDTLKITWFDEISEFGGTITMANSMLTYTPPLNFKGRDQFNYSVTDGQLARPAWVQVDVTDGELLMRYDFEQGGSTAIDQSGANLDGNAKNFYATTVTGVAGNAWYFPLLPDADGDTNPATRAYIDYGDVVDPIDGSYTVSIWFKIDSYSFDDAAADNERIYLIGNSATADTSIVDGYNIFSSGSQKLTFEVKEQMSAADGSTSDIITIRSGSNIPVDTWTHGVMVIDRSVNEIRAYMNNQLVGTRSLKNDGVIKGKPSGDIFSSGALGMSNYKPEMSTPFVGAMDEYRVYSRALTPAEIDVIYNDPGASLTPITNEPKFNSSPINKGTATAEAYLSKSIAGDATDPDGDPLTFSKVSGPAWLTVHPGGAIDGTPSASDTGSNQWVVQVDDGDDGIDQAILWIKVREAADTTILFDEDFDFQPPGIWVNNDWTGTSSVFEVVADSDDIFGAGIDNQVLRIAPSSGVGGSINIPDTAIVRLSFDFYHVADDGVPFGYVQFQPYGVAKLFKFKLSNGEIKEDNNTIGTYGTDVVHFGLTIDNMMNLVTLDADGIELGRWATYADEDTMDYFAISAFGSTTIQADPMYIDNLVIYQVSEGGTEVNPPEFTSDPIIKPDAKENTFYLGSIAGTAIDPEDDPLTFSKVAGTGPDWLTVATNGIITGTPGDSDLGLNQWTVQVDDGNGGSDQAILRITVVEEGINNPPEFTSDPIIKGDATERAFYSSSIKSTAIDLDDDPLTFSKVAGIGPAWLTVASNGVIAGTPGASDVGVNLWTVQVDDGRGELDQAILEIRVTEGTNPAFLFEERFDSQAPGAWDNSAWTGTSSVYEVVADAGDIFGSGTDNQVLRMAPTAGVGGELNVANTDIVTLSFDYYHVGVGGATPKGAVQFQPYGTAKLFKFKLDGGNIKKDNSVIGSYGDAVVHFDLTIDNVANKVTLDVDGVELGNWATYADVDTMNRFAVSCFYTNTAQADPMYIENLIIFEGYEISFGIDLIDWAKFANAWLSTPSDINWIEDYDLHQDYVIDVRDFAVFIENWLAF
ncbi:MAG: cadherin-like domain-containing protein [Anaerohalosphaera sp.]|nr:cadherin-like domain-containing protein [Anaerohalosphaera sp.]